MKKIIWFFPLLAISCLLFSEEVVFAIGEWPPYTSPTERGLATEIVQAACRSVNIQSTIIHVPWLRAENYVEKGEAFATFPYAITEERLSKYVFSAPIIKSTNSIVYGKNNPRIKADALTGIGSFKGYVIGISSGSDALIVPLRKAGAEVETTESIDASMRKLQSGRIDFIVEDTFVIDDLLDRFKDTAIIRLDRKVLSLDREYHVMASAKNEENKRILSRINEGLTLIRKSGELQKILDKY